MTTQTYSQMGATNWYATATDAELADFIAMTKNAIARFQEDQGRAEQALTQRLQERGALELAHPTLEVKLLYPSPTYDVPTLLILAEIVPPEDYAKAYQPAWVKAVPQAARFDGRVLNTLARKYGTPVTAILEQAKLPSSPRLVVKVKEEAPHASVDQEADIRHTRP